MGRKKEDLTGSIDLEHLFDIIVKERQLNQKEIMSLRSERLTRLRILQTGV